MDACAWAQVEAYPERVAVLPPELFVGLMRSLEFGPEPGPARLTDVLFLLSPV